MSKKTSRFRSWAAGRNVQGGRVEVAILPVGVIGNRNRERRRRFGVVVAFGRRAGVEVVLEARLDVVTVVVVVSTSSSRSVSWPALKTEPANGVVVAVVWTLPAVGPLLAHRVAAPKELLPGSNGPEGTSARPSL